MTQLPRYRCHKVVRAAKIVRVEPIGSGYALLHVAGDHSIQVDTPFTHKHNPQPGGYYVSYADGYASYSPAEAFEAGYTRIDEQASELLTKLVDVASRERAEELRAEYRAPRDLVGEAEKWLHEKCIGSDCVDSDHQLVRALLAEVRRLREAQTWQPIETAPQDQWVRVVDEEGLDHIAKHEQPNKWRDRAGYTIWRPTHWTTLIPLPSDA